MKFVGLAAAAFAAFSFGTGAASASTVTYDFTTDPLPSGPFTFACDTAGIANGGTCTVTHSSAGLGVDGPGVIVGDTDPYHLDTFPAPSYETLEINFDYAVQLVSFLLGDFNPPFDNYYYSLDGGSTWSSLQTDNPQDFGPYPVINSLQISAAAVVNPFNSFSVKSITVVTPLPAAGLLFGSAFAGLLGFIGLRGRKSAAAA